MTRPLLCASSSLRLESIFSFTLGALVTGHSNLRNLLSSGIGVTTCVCLAFSSKALNIALSASNTIQLWSICFVTMQMSLMACSCTGPGTGQGTGNDGFLYHAMYCTHHTGTGTGTGNHCFLLCPSQSLSLSCSRSRAVCMIHKSGSDTVMAPVPPPVLGTWNQLSSHVELILVYDFVHLESPSWKATRVVLLWFYGWSYLNSAGLANAMFPFRIMVFTTPVTSSSRYYSNNSSCSGVGYVGTVDWANRKPYPFNGLKFFCWHCKNPCEIAEIPRLIVNWFSWLPLLLFPSSSK